MEIKLEPDDNYISPEFIKTVSFENRDNSTLHIKLETSNSDVPSPAYDPVKNPPTAIFIKQEDCNSNHENDNLNNKLLPKYESKRKQFTCSFCLYTTDRRRDLFVHRQTHTQISYVKCIECGTQHKSPVPTTWDNPFKCDKCKEKPPKKPPKKRKGREKYLYCNSCGFKAAGLLRFQMLHELVCHKVEKPFTCASCDYKCVTQSALTDHSVQHIGGNPFPCSICHHRTDSQESLEVHMITHKPLLCAHCDYRCATQPTLNKHLKTHQVETGGEKNSSVGLQNLQTVKMEDVSINDKF